MPTQERETVQAQRYPVPPRIDRTGNPVYVIDGPTNTLVKGALFRLEGIHGEQAMGLRESMLFQPSETHVIDITTEMLLDTASRLDGSGTRETKNEYLSASLFQLALAIEESHGKAISPSLEVASTRLDQEGVNLETLLPDLNSNVLSNGETFFNNRKKEVHELAQRRVGTLLERINKPFTVVLDVIKTSLEQNLDIKKQRLMDTGVDAEERHDLQANIIAITANTHYCNVFKAREADYHNFGLIAQELTAAIQDEINSRVDIPNTEIIAEESKLQALSSLKQQLEDLNRQRNNAILYIYGEPAKPASGLNPEAIAIKRKRLSEEVNEVGVPHIDAMATDKLSIWLSDLLEEKLEHKATLIDLVDIYEHVSGDQILLRELLSELGKSQDLNESTTAQEFIKANYVTSSKETRLNVVKGHIMKILIPALDEELGCDTKRKFDQIVDDISKDITLTDLVEAEEARQDGLILSQTRQNLGLILEILNIPAEDREKFISMHKDDLTSVLMSYYEVSLNANDEHLNPNAIIKSLTQAKFNAKPLSLQTIRCLRWCYPFRQLEITPDASDWHTWSSDGREITRREGTDREKIVLYRKAIVDPIQHHGIPIKEVVIVATGDYDLVGKGYGYNENDRQPKNARSYVEDIRTRLPKWNVFGNIPSRITSFKEMTEEYGFERFASLRASIGEKYDQLFANHRAHFLGYNSQQIERLIDAEHNTRTPFIADWTRQRSRDLTRDKITYELAMSVLLAQQNVDYPTILTVSGTQPAATTFAKGYAISEGTPPLGITLFKSINDGDQPDYYKQNSLVI